MAGCQWCGIEEIHHSIDKDLSWPLNALQNTSISRRKVYAIDGLANMQLLRTYCESGSDSRLKHACGPPELKIYLAT